MNDNKPVDFEYVTTTHISHYRYVITRLVLNTSVSITIFLYSDTDPYFNKSIEMTVEGEEYRLWGTDDSYISDLIAAKVASLCPKVAEPVVKDEPVA